MFDTGARPALVATAALGRGGEEIARLATEMWDLERTYLADPRRVLQVRDTALVLAGGTINVARRGDDGSWRYAISFLALEKTTREER